MASKPHNYFAMLVVINPATGIPATVASHIPGSQEVRRSEVFAKLMQQASDEFQVPRSNLVATFFSVEPNEVT